MKVSPTVLIPIASVVLGSVVVAWSIVSPIELPPATYFAPRPTPPIPSLPSVTLDKFVQVWNKQLFTPPRPAPVLQPKDAVPAAEPALPKPIPELSLEAILFSEKVRLAVFSHNATGARVHLAEGEEQNGLKVDKIHADTVDAVFAGEQLTLKLTK